MKNKHPEKIKLSPQFIKKLYAAKIETRLWNNNFLKSVVDVTCNRNRLCIEVQGTHPDLYVYVNDSVKERPVALWYNSLLYTEVPEELNKLIEDMKICSTMTQEQAEKSKQQMLMIAIDFINFMEGK